MDPNAIKNLIEKDRIKEALIAMKEMDLSDDQKEHLILLKSRFSDIEKKNISGIISHEDYHLEKNKIRSGILSVLDNEPLDIKGLKKGGFNWKILLITIIPIFAFGSWAIYHFTSTAADEIDIQKIVKNGLIQDEITYNIPKISFKEEKSYEAGIAAKLTKLYQWKVSIPVKVETSLTQVEFDEANNDLKVIVDKVRLLQEISISDQSSTLVTSSMWEDPNAKDGQFWANINDLTLNKIVTMLTSDNVGKDNILKGAEDKIQSRINLILANNSVPQNINTSISINELRIFD